MLWQDKVMFTQYSSTDGGRTVQGSRPYLWAVDDPDDAASPYHRWRVAFPVDQVAALFQWQGVIVAAQRVGDTVSFTLQGSDGATATAAVDAGELRRRINAGFPKPATLPLPVPSTRYAPSVDAPTGQLVLDGGGWGHGVGMSQYGALGKARRGMTAPDILAAYYGGIRPTAIDPARLPATIRVALSAPGDAVDVRANGSFRVLDDAGRPLVTLGEGSWRVEPAEGGVRVLPPVGYDEPLPAESVVLRPPVAATDGRGTLRFDLAAPARVTVVVTPPHGPASRVVTKALRPGAHTVALRARPRPGTWKVVVEAVAGVDHRASVPLTYRVPAAVRGAAAGPVAPVRAVRAVRPSREPSPVLPAAAAAVLVALAAAGLEDRLHVAGIPFGGRRRRR